MLVNIELIHDLSLEPTPIWFLCPQLLGSGSFRVSKDLLIAPMVSSQPSPDLICQWHFTVLRSPTVLKTFLLCPPEPQTLLDSLWTEGRLFYQIFLFPIYKSWWAPNLLPFSLYSVLWSSTQLYVTAFQFTSPTQPYPLFLQYVLHESTLSCLRLYSQSKEWSWHLVGPPVFAETRATNLSRRAVPSATLPGHPRNMWEVSKQEWTSSRSNHAHS